MDDTGNFRRIKTIFWLTFVVGLGTFFFPFLEGEVRWKIYWMIFEMYVLDGRQLTMHFAIIITLIFATSIWLPIIGYAFYRYTVQKRYYTIKQRLVNYFLFWIGISIYVLPVYALIHSGRGIKELEVLQWGYWLLLICTTILFICYLKIQKRQLIEDDLSEHLIIEK